MDGKHNENNHENKKFGFLNSEEYKEFRKKSKLIAIFKKLPDLIIDGAGIVKKLEVTARSTESDDKALLHKLLERTRRY